VELAVVGFGAADVKIAAAKTAAAVLAVVGVPAGPGNEAAVVVAAATVEIDSAVIWPVDAVADAAVTLVLAAEQLLGPGGLEGFQVVEVAGFAAPEPATVASAAAGTFVVAFA